MKLNILTRSISRTPILGARKVLHNTLKALDCIGIEFSINEPIAHNRYNWIHDDPEGIIEAGFVGRPVLVGPNTAATPHDLPKFRGLLHPSSIYLLPSEWTLKAWKAVNFNECNICVWPAGIDTECFPTRPRHLLEKEYILIYFKHRSQNLLYHVQSLVQKTGYDFLVLRYGNYDESEYRSALNRAKCGIWVAGTESQGFALMEALATGLPLIVLEANSLECNVYEPDNYLIPHFTEPFISSGATAAPYFDQRCGIVTPISCLTDDLINHFLQHVDQFEPAKYVHERFTLEHSARELVALAELLPALSVKPQPLLSASAKMLLYLDLATRRWPWQLALQRLFSKNS